MILPHRHTIRLQKHDYSSPQIYSITIGSYHHYQLFGQIENRIFYPNEIGQLIKEILISLPQHHHCQLIAFQIMPNHLHFILKTLNQKYISSQTIGAQRAAPLHFGIQSNSLPCIIRSFKSECTKQIHQQKIYFSQIFQRNYFEHIIRNKRDLIIHKKYIENNPQNWFYDPENKTHRNH